MKKRSYMEQTYFLGRVWGLVLFFLMVAFPFVLCIVFKTVPQWEALGKGILAVAPLFCTIGVIEVFTYIPMLGAGGSYISFVTGNCSNLKLPVAIDALEKTGVSATTEEGECVSTIAIAVSNIVTTLIIVVGVIFIAPLSSVLQNPVLNPCFQTEVILAALFGALGVAFITKNIKVALPLLLVLIVINVLVPGMGGLVSVLVPVGVLLSIGLARFLYKKGKI